MPREIDVEHATEGAASVFERFFEEKNSLDVDRWMSTFAEDLTYSDANLGWVLSRQEMHDFLSDKMSEWEGGSSNATKVLGTETSAVLFIRDTPELFGGELFIIACADLADGVVTRWVDYWDGRHFGLEAGAQMRTPADQFPPSFGEEKVPETADPAIREAIDGLVGALGAGDAEGAASRFSPDARLEDVTLHAAVHGSEAIGRYLARGLDPLPWGAGSRLRRAFGSATAGGYEWVSDGSVPRGITALELDRDGLVTELTTVWDGSLLDEGRIRELTLLSVEDKG